MLALYLDTQLRALLNIRIKTCTYLIHRKVSATGYSLEDLEDRIGLRIKKYSSYAVRGSRHQRDVPQLAGEENTTIQWLKHIDKRI